MIGSDGLAVGDSVFRLPFDKCHIQTKREVKDYGTCDYKWKILYYIY